MKDSLVAGLNRLIDRGTNLFVEGKDVRTLTAGIEWQGHADQFKQEAKAWVKEQSPDDAVRLETLSPYPAVNLPLGNPWQPPTPVLGIIASCTSSALCEENNPVSYHLALVNRLEKIVSDWRVKLPKPPIAAAKRGRPGHDKSLKERGDDWAHEQLTQPRRTYTAVAQDISKEQGVPIVTVLREARKSRERRGKAG